MSLFTWGCNKHKQLIDQTGLHRYAPVHVSSSVIDDQTPIEIAAGDQHVLVLCESGDLYAFGDGQEGQLGNGKRWGGAKAKGNKVLGLENDTVVHIAAGAHTSYAITSTGSVYQWGLIHTEELAVGAPIAEEEEVGNAQAGQLTGLAQDQSHVIEPEQLSRRQRAEAAARSGTNIAAARSGANTVQQQSRTLRDIVQESNHRWMISSEDADSEFFAELQAMGYHIEEAEERMQGRGREYHGMLRMTCRREVQTLPVRIQSLSHVRIHSISAGYAHVLALSEDGRIYAAGYNDRGQLGLGHRINTSLFKEVDFLASKMVIQIACGQQHSLCRAVDRGIGGIDVGGKDGADVYIWGNGVLGQLGLGRKGTTKGRLLPTIIPGLHQRYPAGIVDIAAGANFTVVVTIQGSVYSFGHAEYNQHGIGSESHRDYVDPYYYFEPRPVALKAHIVSVACGAVFTVASDTLGNVFSWGWNESGVLGHGSRHFSSSPEKISCDALYSAGKVAQICTGSKHVVALVNHYGSPWVNAYRAILQEPKYYDMAIVMDSNQSIPCHSAILSARSSYLKGYIAAAKSERGHADDGHIVVRLSGTYYNSITVKCLLEYLYLDRLQVPEHKKREVLQLARELTLADMQDLLLERTHHTKRDKHATRSKSFVADLHNLLGDKNTADVVFVHANNEKWSVFGHRCILSRINYFDTFFSASFADCNQQAVINNKVYYKVDITGLLDDMTEEVFVKMLDYAYTYTLEEEKVDVNEAMGLLVAANRVGFSTLALICERLISISLRHGNEEDLHLCLDFCQQFNLNRLERQCQDMLRVLPLSRRK